MLLVDNVRNWVVSGRAAFAGELEGADVSRRKANNVSVQASA